LPVGASIELVDNEIGVITKEDDSYYLKFKKIVTKDGKELECVHSGNVNDIKLPTKLPSYTILRREIAEALEKKGLKENSTPLSLEPKCDG
jgi:putative protease